jgi:hypothetical protein
MAARSLLKGMAQQIMSRRSKEANSTRVWSIAAGAEFLAANSRPRRHPNRAISAIAAAGLRRFSPPIK